MDSGVQNSAGPAIHNELVKFYKSLLPKPLATVTLFDRGDFHSLIGQDACFVSKEIMHRATQQIKGADGSILEYINVNRTQFEGLVREILLTHFYRVEIYDCKTWKLAYKGSPGNVSQFEDILFNSSQETSQTFGVAALAVQTQNNEKIVGIALADQTSRNLIVSEFIDNDRFSNLEALFVQLSPKECIIQPGAATPTAVREVLENMKILTTEKKKAEFNCSNISQDLERLLKLPAGSTIESITELDKKLAMGCLSAAINYLEFLSDESNFQSYKLQSFDLNQYMKLDHAAVSALNLIPNKQDGKEHSLYGVLNHCKTIQGQRLLRQWIKQPLTDLYKIEERLNMVEIFVENTLLRQTISTEHLQALPDYQKLAKRLITHRANLQDCYRIYQSLKRLPNLDECLEGFDGEYKHVLKHLTINPIKELMMDLSKFSDLVEEVLDMDSVDSLDFLVKPDFDEQLGIIGESMKQIEHNFSKQLNKAATDLGVEAQKTVKLDSNSIHGHFFRLTRKDEKLLRNNKNYEVLDTKKDGVRFTNRQLGKLNQEYKQLKSDYHSLQKSILVEIMKVAAGYAEPLYQLSDVIAELDVLVSLATASSNAPIPYTRPQILTKGSGVIRLEELRHPCLELMDTDYIPNNITFSKGSSMFHIITGPNMGGKSTYIRSVGMACLMAQIGCYVPCSTAEITIVDTIMARVGAGDSQVKGVSTFMAEMVESAGILKAATENSLVIIDELGRGTSTYDGFGLAWSISHYIATRIRCFTLFATHFHELTALSDEVDHVKNLHVTAITTDDELTLLYKVVPGVCDESFGIHVSKMVKFPEHVIRNAEIKVKELEDDHVQTDGSGDRVTLKRHREESYTIYESLIKKLKTSCNSESSSHEIKEVLQQIKQDCINSNNPYINQLVTSAS